MHTCVHTPAGVHAFHTQGVPLLPCTAAIMHTRSSECASGQACPCVCTPTHTHTHTRPVAGNLSLFLLSESSPVPCCLSRGHRETQRPGEQRPSANTRDQVSRHPALRWGEEVMPLDPILAVRAGGRKGGILGRHEAQLETGSRLAALRFPDVHPQGWPPWLRGPGPTSDVLRTPLLRPHLMI